MPWGNQPPSASGSGLLLVRGSGLLQGHTDAGGAGGPAIVNQGTYPAFSFYVGDTIRIYQPNASFDVTFEFVDGSSPVTGAPVSISGLTGDLEAQFAALIAEITTAGFTGSVGYDAENNVFSVQTTDSGSSVTLFVAYSRSAYGGIDRPFSTDFGTNASGTDEIPPSGAITEVTIISQDGSKTIKPVALYCAGPGLGVGIEVALKVGSSYFPLGANLSPYQNGVISAIGSYYNEWLAGRASAALVARMTDTPPVGGSQRLVAVVEQI